VREDRMGIMDAIRRRRTIRFYEQRPVGRDTLRELVDAARFAPSGGNVQPLEFVLVDDKEVVPRVFATLAWAGGVKPRRDPPEGKRPVAYVVVLLNRQVRASGGQHDAAAAIENLLLAAWEKGIGSCWLGSVKRDELRGILAIPEHLEIDSVVSLGYPGEQPVAEEMTDSVEYYLDDADRLHVPKRRLADILHANRYGEPGAA
jgi:nitroreductase